MCKWLDVSRSQYSQHLTHTTQCRSQKSHLGIFDFHYIVILIIRSKYIYIFKEMKLLSTYDITSWPNVSLYIYINYISFDQSREIIIWYVYILLLLFYLQQNKQALFAETLEEASSVSNHLLSITASCSMAHIAFR